MESRDDPPHLPWGKLSRGFPNLAAFPAPKQDPAIRRLQPSDFCSRAGKKAPPPIVRGKGNYPLHYPTTRTEPPEAGCLCAASQLLRRNTSAGHSPHQPSCHSAENNRLNVTPPDSQGITTGVQRRQCNDALSIGTTHTFQHPRSPGYVSAEMTPSKSRGLDEPPRVGGTHSAVPSAFELGRSSRVPPLFGALVPPPPTAGQGQKGGGGTGKVTPVPPPPLSRG